MLRDCFDISAFLFLLCLITYYVKRRYLPIRRNGLFLAFMFLCQGAALSNYLVILFCFSGGQYPLWIRYVVNILSFSVLAVCPLFILLYCITLSDYFLLSFKFGRIWACIPAAAVIVLAVTSPWTGLFFEKTAEGEIAYTYGPYLIYAESCLYLFHSLLHILNKKRNLRRLCRYSVYALLAMTFLGHTAQLLFSSQIHTVSFCMTLGVLVMFLTFQNPDFYKENVARLLNLEGFRLLKEDDIRYGIKRKAVLITFENYEDLLNVYGSSVMRQLQESFGNYLRTDFVKDALFYVHNGRFLLIAKHGRGYYDFRDKLMRRCERPFRFENGEMMLSPCFAYSSDDIVFAAADEEEEAFRLAMEEALSQGSGAIVRIDQKILDRAIHNVKVNRALEKAVHGEGLEVFYQPIFSTKENRINSAEALVRIRDEELGLIYPDEFIWKAEADSSILFLGQRVFEKVCEFIKNNNMKQLGLSYIEVNLSPVQCMRKQLAEEFKEVTFRYGVDPSYINLEITESGNTLSNVIQENMEALTFYGMSFSLDDYGTGFSNLISIFSMPLKIVKVDKSIVWQYFKGNRQVLTHVLDIFKASHLEIVAEGVETKEMVDELTRLGVDFLQGYYFSKPVSEREFLEYMKKTDK